MVGSRPWGQGPREPLPAPNCFVYEALLRASSGFPNELVCCGVSAAELVITSETGGLRLGALRADATFLAGFLPLSLGG